MKDTLGHKSEVIDVATDNTIEKAKSFAFDIERQISMNWNLFLYNFCMLTLEGKNISENYCDDNVFGSWLVRLFDNRIVYDGKDSRLIYQKNKSGSWIDELIIERQDLTYYSFMETLNNLIVVI